MPIIRLPSALQRFTAGRAEIPVEGATAGAALASACARYPDLRIRLFDAQGAVFPYLLLFKANAPATLVTPLSDEDTLEVLAAVEGG